MEFRHTLDGIEIEEPVGFPSIQLSLTRDREKHGIGQQASVSTLGFYEEAAEYLINKYESEGIKANVIYEVTQRCEGETEFSNPLRGRLNFGKYSQNCGNECIVSLPWEHDSCELILRSRYEQNVDIDKLLGFDNLTVLPDYDKIGTPIIIPGKKLRAVVQGNVQDEGDKWDFELSNADSLDGFAIAFRPQYDVEIFNSINTGQLIPSNNYAQLADNGIISPQLLFEDEAECFDNVLDYSLRLKGRVKLDCNAQGTQLQAIAQLWDTTGDWIEGDGQTVLDNSVIFSGDYTANTWIEFDVSFSGTTAMPFGHSFFAFIYWSAFDSDDETGDIFYEFDPETFIDIEMTKQCPDSFADLSLIHETFSRISEAITNGCIRVKSSYYGRTDSEPFSFPEDGCGGLRAVTSGLKLRTAPEDKFFLSLKDLFDGVNAIDNVGWDIIEDPDLPNKFIMRVEKVDFFYRAAEELATHDHIPDMTIAADESLHFAKIMVGYQKWEVERVNGLDEPNSNREYYTSFDTIKTQKDITSKLVAGSYPIEITRQQQYADTGAADTSYDNETFIFCLTRYDFGFNVKQGNIISAANVFSPETLINYEITPVRNLMRWFKTLAAGYLSLGDTNNKLFFSSGTGNITAEGMLSEVYTSCVQEAGVVKENQNVYSAQFANVEDYKPIWKPETINYDYPLSIAEYLRLKANPYGFIFYQCNDGTLKKAFILDILYSVANGSANFTLLKAYTQ